jgi:hypothetical protein
VDIDVMSSLTQTSGSALMVTCADKPGPGNYNRVPTIGLNALFKGTNDEKCEALFIQGGRSSIAHWLRLQGENPVVKNYAGSEALWLYTFRKHRMLGKDSTLVMIIPWKIPMRTGSWTAPAPIDLRYCLGSTSYGPYAEVAPERLATILERTFMGIAA